MEESISTFILVIATIVLGIILVGIAAFYASTQYNATTIQSQAENIANGLYIEVGEGANVTNGQEVFVVVNDFAYQGQLYFTAFYVKSVLKNSTSEISPLFAYMQNGQIVYPSVEVGNSVPNSVTATQLYDINLNLLYQGSPVTLWETPPLTSPVEISLTISPPQGYSTILLFFAHIQNKYIEVGYVWI